MTVSRQNANKGTRTKQQVLGQQGEDLALAHLQQSGLMLVERNFRCRTGEIDLIMLERGTLVFVEVRQRGNAGFGGAAASVTQAKQARLVSAAQQYLQRHSILPPCRFDVVAIDGNGIDWLKNVIDA